MQMNRKTISAEVKEAVTDSIAKFNRDNFADWEIAYIARFKGIHLYLDRSEFGRVTRVCRLTFTGEPKHEWDFAIYKYSTEQYSPDECFFPGDNQVDGTVEGAMRAGMEVYPP
jgi:hypothetical protein